MTKRVVNLDAFRKKRAETSLVDLGKEGYLVDWMDLPVINNAYIRRQLTLTLEQRPREGYIGLHLGLTNWIPEWHRKYHNEKDIVRGTNVWGPPEYVNCTPRDWLHLV